MVMQCVGTLILLVVYITVSGLTGAKALLESMMWHYSWWPIINQTLKALAEFQVVWNQNFVETCIFSPTNNIFELCFQIDYLEEGDTESLNKMADIFQTY